MWVKSHWSRAKKKQCCSHKTAGDRSVGCALFGLGMLCQRKRIWTKLLVSVWSGGPLHIFMRFRMKHFEEEDAWCLSGVDSHLLVIRIPNIGDYREGILGQQKIIQSNACVRHPLGFKTSAAHIYLIIKPDHVCMQIVGYHRRHSPHDIVHLSILSGSAHIWSVDIS